jgi:hypothetical protein
MPFSGPSDPNLRPLPHIRLVLTTLTPVRISILLTTAPHEPLRILLPRPLGINFPMTVLVMIGPEVALPVWFGFTYVVLV